MDSRFEGHTPRPWAISYNSSGLDGDYGPEDTWPDAIYNPETNQVVAVFETGTGRVVSDADIDLMVAAPTLLARVEELEAALKLFVEVYPNLGKDYQIIDGVFRAAQKALEGRDG
jgi:hypothetical protein